MSQKVHWLSRTLISGPRLVLCLSEKQYDEVIKFLVVGEPNPWLDEGCSACVHHFQSSGGGKSAVVCLNTSALNGSSIGIAAVLVHESVHIWQAFREHIGEDAPSNEFEAYSIESISRTLFEEYVRQTTGFRYPSSRLATA